MDTFTLHKHAEDLRDQAWTLRSESDYAQALLVYESSRELYRQLGDRSKQSSVLMEMGDVTLQMGDCDTARHYYDRARAVFGTRSIPSGHKINLLDGLKTISLQQQDFKQALMELSQLLDAYQIYPNSAYERAQTLRGMAEAASQLGYLPDSDTYFAQALRWGDQDDEQAVGILWAWGMAHYQRDQRHSGYQLCQLAFLRAESAFESLVEQPGQFYVDTSTGRRRAVLESLRQQFNELSADQSSRQAV